MGQRCQPRLGVDRVAACILHPTELYWPWGPVRALQKNADYVWDASGTNLDIRTTFVAHFTHIIVALELHTNPLIMTKSWQHSMRCLRS